MALGQTVPNPFPNVVFPGTTMPTDPGAMPSVTACVRYQTDTAYDNVYVCADAINNGTWGYNNLQWVRDDLVPQVQRRGFMSRSKPTISVRVMC